MWARAYTCGQLMSSMLVHVWSVCSREWQQSEDSGGLATPPTPSLSLVHFFFMCCFWRQESKGRATETLTHRVAAYSMGRLCG